MRYLQAIVRTVPIVRIVLIALDREEDMSAIAAIDLTAVIVRAAVIVLIVRLHILISDI